MVIYVDGTFYPRKDLEDIKEQQEDLRNQVYNCMVERSKNSNFQYIEYIKKEKKWLIYYFVGTLMFLMV